LIIFGGAAIVVKKNGPDNEFDFREFVVKSPLERQRLART